MVDVASLQFDVIFKKAFGQTDENAHKFARLSLIFRTSDTIRIENIPDAEEALNAETQSCREAEEIRPLRVG